MVAEARRGKTRTGLTDEQRRIPPKEAAKSVRYLVPEALVLQIGILYLGVRPKSYISRCDAAALREDFQHTTCAENRSIINLQPA